MAVIKAVKKQSKFDLPGPPTDSHGNVIGDNDIPIATIDDPNKQLSETTYKRQKLSPLSSTGSARVQNNKLKREIITGSSEKFVGSEIKQ